MTTTTFGERFFASWYPRFMARVERAGQAGVRRAQLAGARGRTLEIGAGSGLSVPHYPDDLTELVLLEPNPALRTRLTVLAHSPAAPITVVDGDAHALEFPDGSFDTVTASLVFCSVRDPDRALAEVHRVLRPGGSSCSTNTSEAPVCAPPYRTCSPRYNDASPTAATPTATSNPCSARPISTSR